MPSDLTRPIIGIENRTAQEVFDIMCDRFRAAERALAERAGGVKVKALEWFGNATDHCWARFDGEIVYTILQDGTDPETWSLKRGAKLLGYHRAEEDARKAAQADFERHIFAALEPAAPYSEPASNYNDAPEVIAAPEADWKQGVLVEDIPENQKPYHGAFPPAAPEGRQEAVRIGDAVLDWMVKFDLLDAGNEYYVSDVLAVLNDLTPSTRPAEQAVTEAGEGLLRIVEEIDGAMNHGTWRDDNGVRFKDTPEWVAFYVALKAAMEARG